MPRIPGSKYPDPATRRYNTGMIKKLMLGVIALLLFSGAGFYALKPRPTAEQDVVQTSSDHFRDDKTGLSFDFSPELTKTELNAKDSQDKILLRLTHSQPSLLITVRYEEGLRQASVISRLPLKDMLIENSDRSLPQRFPGYSKLSRRTFQQNGHEAIEYIFTYNNNEQLLKQRFVILIVDADRAVYIAAQAKEADFATVSSRYFDPLLSTVAFD